MVHNIHVSLVLFTARDAALCAYLVDGHLPSLPLVYGKTLDDTLGDLKNNAVGEAVDAYIEQLYTTADPIEKGSIEVVYVGLVSSDKLTEKALAAMKPLGRLSKKLAESAILSYALQRLRWKVEYTNVVYSLLPKSFTLTELQKIYEAILDKKLDKRNFRKKILALGILKDTGSKRSLGKARPAETYSFVSRKLAIVEIL